MKLLISTKSIFILMTVLLIGIIAGCGGMRPTVFLHGEYNFSFLEKVAVIPFDNLSKDQGAGARATRVFISELLSTETFDVVEPGEVNYVLEKLNLVRTDALTKEQIVKIGKELGIQGIFLGTVTESSQIRSGNSSAVTLTIVGRLVETETGETIWSATNTAGGKGFWSSLFGVGNKSQSEVMRDCIKGLLHTLIK